MRRASITIFSLLSMLLVASLLFTLLEGTRYQEMKRLSQLQTNLAVESFFAGYNAYLWNEYHLLAVEKMEMEEKLMTAANGRNSEELSGVNVFGFSVKNMNVKGYTLLTDGNGAAYIKAVSAYMEKNIVYEAVTSIYEQYEILKGLQEESGFDVSIISEALEGIKEAAEEEIEGKNVESGKMYQNSDYQTTSVGDAQNLLKEAENIMKKDVLTLVLKDVDSISTEELDLSDVVSKRNLQQGENSDVEEVEWMDKILLQQYFRNYMSNYSQQKDGRCLLYELEYLIAGKSTDYENLKGVVTQLLAIRGAANFAYLLSDEVKMQEVTLLATTLIGATLNPILLELVKTALLTAWAFAESVLDVRALLQGKNISLLKNSDLWTLDIEDIGSISKDFAVAKESSVGISYEGYLGILLLFQENNTLAMHAMDVQEAAVRKGCDYSGFQMDGLVVWADVEICYTYMPLFLSLGENLWKGDWNYELQTRTEFGY